MAIYVGFRGTSFGLVGGGLGMISYELEGLRNGRRCVDERLCKSCQCKYRIFPTLNMVGGYGIVVEGGWISHPKL
jgi:hypothetical protein